jgi:hypothetical protein
MGRLGLSEHSECVARVRTRIVAGFVAGYARRCLADRGFGAASAGFGRSGAASCKCISRLDGLAWLECAKGRSWLISPERSEEFIRALSGK